MPKIILCRGIQGSGKTTWAKQWALEDSEHREDLNLTKNSGNLNIYYPYNPFITENSTKFENQLNSG